MEGALLCPLLGVLLGCEDGGWLCDSEGAEECDTEGASDANSDRAVVGIAVGLYWVEMKMTTF